MTNQIDSSTDEGWWTGEVQYEGVRMMLRYRDFVDCTLLSATRPRCLLVSHALAEVRADGLPVSDYNKTLFDFDIDLVETVEKHGGLVTIIETLSGERNYYFYVPVEFDIDAPRAVIAGRYPNHKLEWSTFRDAECKLIHTYKRDFSLRMVTV